jgi:hypothetical protein
MLDESSIFSFQEHLLCFFAAKKGDLLSELSEAGMGVPEGASERGGERSVLTKWWCHIADCSK